MNVFRKSILGLLVVVFFAGVAWGQAPLQIREAELAIPFGSVDGQILVLGDYLVFVDSDRPEHSFAILKKDVADLEWQGSLLKLATVNPVEDRSGQRSELVFKVDQPFDLSEWWQRGAASAEKTAPAPSAEAAPKAAATKPYSVRHNHRFGGCEGRLMIADNGLVYESVGDLSHSRKWDYSGIKTLKLENPYTLKVEPFQGNGYKFEILGQGIEGAVYDKLVDRVAAARNAP